MLQGTLAVPNCDTAQIGGYELDIEDKRYKEVACPSGPPVDHYQASTRRFTKVRNICLLDAHGTQAAKVKEATPSD